MFERFKRPPTYDKYTKDQYEKAALGSQIRREVLEPNLNNEDYYLNGLINLELRGDESILVIGSGDGYAERRLRSELGHTGRIVALEIPAGDNFDFEARFYLNYMALIEEGLQGFETVSGRAEALPFRRHSFDVVIADHMLYHSPDTYQALMEIMRVAKRGAKILARSNGVGNKLETHIRLGRIAERVNSNAPAPFSSNFDTDVLLHVMSKIFTRQHKPLVQRGFVPISDSQVADKFAGSIDTYAISMAPRVPRNVWEETRRQEVDEPIALAIERSLPIFETIHRGGDVFTNDKTFSMVGELAIRNLLRRENTIDQYLARRRKIVRAYIKRATPELRTLL